MDTNRSEASKSHRMIKTISKNRVLSSGQKYRGLSLTRPGESAGWVIASVALIPCALAFVILLAREAMIVLARPQIVIEQPSRLEQGVDPMVHPVIRFDKRMSASTINDQSIQLRDENQAQVASSVTYDPAHSTAVVSPRIPLKPGGTYTLEVRGKAAPEEGKRQADVEDLLGRTAAESSAVRFTVGTSDVVSSAASDVPILLVTSHQNGFSQYYAEILRNEGLNEFSTVDIADVGSKTLDGKSIVLMGEVVPTRKQVSLLSTWVHAGGELIAMRPTPLVAGGIGVVTEGGRRPGEFCSDAFRGAYLAIQASSPAGAGLFHKPLQFHGPADAYTYRNATAVATLYYDYERRTDVPAISSVKVGKGDAIFYNYDLAKSVVFTRQGNPGWSGKERDGISPIRSDDLFYGNSATDPEPDWVDGRNIEVPQADEQQRLLANIITVASQARTPLPHFWYLPKGFKAAVVMTGDDHGNGGTVKRFKHYLALSARDCSVEDWECVRATSNIFVNSITSAQAELLNREGFEIGLHIYTGCKDWPTTMVRQADGTLAPQMNRIYANALYQSQFASFAAKYPALPSPVSNRIDCVTWGDYDTQPQVERSHGVRFDTNYYYWPGKFVQNRPGLFTGSGLPMRFAKRDGSVMDVYQAATQMTDESAQEYPSTFDTLLANALGDREYYAVFTVNMHNDRPRSAAADSIIAASLSHNIPVVTAAQMLRWLDGRNGSSFRILSHSNNLLKFHLSVGVGGNGIQALVPLYANSERLTALTLNGSPIKFVERDIAGLSYAAFAGDAGDVVASYQSSTPTAAMH